MIWPHLDAFLCPSLSHWWNHIQNIPKRSTYPAQWSYMPTCKIIRVNIELAILAFILPTSGHANFECQHMPPCFLVKFTYQETSLLAKIIEDRWLILVHHLCFYSKTNKTSSAMLLGTNQDNNIIFAVFICTWWVRYKPEYTPPRLWILDAMARTIFTTYA